MKPGVMFSLTLIKKYNSPGSFVAPIIFSAFNPLENPFGRESDFFELLSLFEDSAFPIFESHFSP